MPAYTVALGTFDGLHIGHKAVLDNIINEDSKPIALTFNLPPKNLDGGGLIMSPEEKLTAIKEMGITPVVLDFEKVKNHSPEEFLDFILLEYKPKIISCGFNYKFGNGARGSTEILADFCLKNGIEYRLTQAVNWQDSPVSSTRIRQCIASGDMVSADKMLGRPFSFANKVLHGDERGRTIGFPTINQNFPKNLVIPRFGVYASITEIEGKYFSSITNVGIRPTFETEYITSETNIIDYNDYLYDKWVKIHLLEFIRPEIKFKGLEELKGAIDKDIKKTIEILSKGKI